MGPRRTPRGGRRGRNCTLVLVPLGAMLSERRAGATLGDMQLRSHLLNAGTATRGVYKFPREASCNELVQRQIRDRSAQPAVLELKLLQALDLQRG